MKFGIIVSVLVAGLFATFPSADDAEIGFNPCNPEIQKC